MEVQTLHGSLTQVSSADSNSYFNIPLDIATKSQEKSYKANNDVATRTPTAKVVDQTTDPLCIRTPKLVFRGVVLQLRAGIPALLKQSMSIFSFCSNASAVFPFWMSQTWKQPSGVLIGLYE